MKKIIYFSFILAIGCFAKAKPDQSKFPQLISWQGSPILSTTDHKKVLLKKNEELKSSFAISTSASDQAEILFQNGEILRISPSSKIQVPHMNDRGYASEIFLHEGTVQIKNESLKTSSKIRLKSEFFDLELPASINLVVQVDSKKPSATFNLIQGEITVAFFDFEKSEHLKAGEGVTFVGENDESGHIKYDYLLNNKKAPHGVLHEKEKFNAANYLQKEKEFLKAKMLEQVKVKKAEALRIQNQKKLIDSFLCHGPNGKLDQCYWKVESSLCFRYRCNAQGQWGDKTERPVNENCAEPAKVLRCDY